MPVTPDSEVRVRRIHLVVEVAADADTASGFAGELADHVAAQIIASTEWRTATLNAFVKVEIETARDMRCPKSATPLPPG
jgi:hypothetical protein